MMIRPIALACTVLLALPCGAFAQTGDLRRASALFERADYGGARGEVQVALRRDAGNAEALYWNGRLLLAESKPAAAVEQFERAARADARNATYQLWLGNALGVEASRASRLRQPFLAKRVQAAFERAVELDPRQIDARMGLVQFHAVAPGVVGGSMAKAREHATAILRLEARRGHLALAYVAEREKDLAGAARAYEAAIAAAPDSIASYVALSLFHQRNEQWANAFAAIDRGLQRDPNNRALWYQLGRTGGGSGLQLARSRTALERWIASPPDDASPWLTAAVHARLGQILDHQGERERARAAYRTALRINPDNPEAKRGLSGK